MNSTIKSEHNDKGLEGRYANHLDIGLNAFEFVMDFALHFHDIGETGKCARIITSPGENGGHWIIGF